MPIGKNSIKRAVNNGYSNVKTTAPDMENSVVVEPAPTEEKNPPVKKAACRKAPTKKTEAVKAEPVKTEPKKAPVRKAKAAAKPTVQKVPMVAVGEALPVYLL